MLFFRASTCLGSISIVQTYNLLIKYFTNIFCTLRYIHCNEFQTTHPLSTVFCWGVIRMSWYSITIGRSNLQETRQKKWKMRSFAGKNQNFISKRILVSISNSFMLNKHIKKPWSHDTYNDSSRLYRVWIGTHDAFIVSWTVVYEFCVGGHRHHRG